MKLMSCNSCGVILDADKIEKPNIELPDGSVDRTKTEWDGSVWVPVVDCPVCDNSIVFLD